MVAVKVYVEGGGERKDLKTECRRGFSKFFERAGFKGKMPQIIACGGRKSAYDDFCTAVAAGRPDEFVVLLVDSEDPIAQGTDPWTHLNSRQGDGWIKPNTADRDSAQLMVQCMEAWFLADKLALSAFYGSGFTKGSLPQNPDIEKIHKPDILNGLANASRHTRKGTYSKGAHSFKILAQIDPIKVQRASEYAERLLKLLSLKLA